VGESDLELRVVSYDSRNALLRWLGGIVRVSVSVISEGGWPPYPRTSLQVVEQRTKACLAHSDFGRDVEGAEAARRDLAGELARLPLEELCATYSFVRHGDGS